MTLSTGLRIPVLQCRLFSQSKLSLSARPQGTIKLTSPFNNSLLCYFLFPSEPGRNSSILSFRFVIKQMIPYLDVWLPQKVSNNWSVSAACVQIGHKTDLGEMNQFVKYFVLFSVFTVSLF